MKGKFFKKIVSIIVCVSMIMAFASVSNAYSGTISSGSFSSVGTSTLSKKSNSYSYYISFIQYNGLPEGAHMAGLRLRADQGNDSNFVCSVNTNQGGGTYTVKNTGSHTYRLYNSTGRNVTITGSFTYK